MDFFNSTWQSLANGRRHNRLLITLYDIYQLYMYKKWHTDKNKMHDKLTITQSLIRQILAIDVRQMKNAICNRNAIVAAIQYPSSLVTQ